jgi:hypothetical protein
VPDQHVAQSTAKWVGELPSVVGLAGELQGELGAGAASRLATAISSEHVDG